MKKLNIFMAGFLSFTFFLLLAPTQFASAIVFSSKVASKTKVTSITCYKATTSKKVTSISPKCSTGWTTKKPAVTPNPKPTVSSGSFIPENIPFATITTCANVAGSGEVGYGLLNPFSKSYKTDSCDLHYIEATWQNSLLIPIPKNNINTATVIFCLPIVPPNTPKTAINLAIYTNNGNLSYLGKCRMIVGGNVPYFPTIYWREALIPSAPTVTSITQIDGYSVAINFTENYPLSVSSPIGYYLVKENSTLAPIIANPSKTKPNQVIFTGLSPNSTYQFSIAAVNSDGISLYSTVSDNFTTSAPATSPLGVPSVLDNKSYGIDQKGPGGGTVFYYSENAFTELSASCGSQCHYLEFAPLDWNSSNGFPWSSNYYATSAGLGTVGGGLANTKNMTLFDLSLNNSASLVLSYAGANNSKGEWFIPSDLELALFSQSKVFNAMTNNNSLDIWSSTDACLATSVPNTTTTAGCSTYAIDRGFGINGRGKQSDDRKSLLSILPVHAF